MNAEEKRHVETALLALAQLKAARRRDFILYHNTPGETFRALAAGFANDVRILEAVISRLAAALASDGKENKT